MKTVGSAGCPSMAAAQTVSRQASVSGMLPDVQVDLVLYILYLNTENKYDILRNETALFPCFHGSL